MRRASILGVMVVGIALLLWAGWHNLRERKLAMQKARENQVVLIPDKGGQAEGEDDLAPKMRGKKAPNFTLTNLDGKKVSLADYKGRPVLINFWATWCGPCKVEMPWFEQLRNHHIRLSPAAKMECEDVLARINRFYYSRNMIHRGRLLSAFYDLLMLIHEQCRPEMEVPQKPTDRQRYVQSIIDYIEEGYMKDIELERMASDLHMNRFHLMKVFREVTGMTVFDYLYRRRVNQAKILFYQSDQNTVTDVGFQVGFKHLSHFSRVFKKQAGVTPAEYRKMLQRSERDPERLESESSSPPAIAP